MLLSVVVVLLLSRLSGAGLLRGTNYTPFVTQLLKPTTANCRPTVVLPAGWFGRASRSRPQPSAHTTRRHRRRRPSVFPRRTRSGGPSPPSRSRRWLAP